MGQLKKAEKAKIIKAETIYVVDEETEFLCQNIDKRKCSIIASPTQFQEFLDNPFHVKNAIIFVELNWDNSIPQFHGYQVAKELMNSPNRLSRFNFLFISYLKRETIFTVLKNKNRIFTQKFGHDTIQAGFEVSESLII